MKVLAIKTSTFKPDQDLVEFVINEIRKSKSLKNTKSSKKHLPEGSVVVITSKIVSLAQNRLAPGGEPAKPSVVKSEAERYIKTRWCYLALKDGHWCPNGGIDLSNADNEQIILWPHQLFETARSLREKIKKEFGVKKLGVLITDSRTFPLRAGVHGVALGYAGFKGLRSYVGQKDLFGRTIKMSRTNVADSLASAAVLLMGEGAERQPLAVIAGAPVEFTNTVNQHELAVDIKSDLYRPLYRALEKSTLKKGGSFKV